MKRWSLLLLSALVISILHLQVFFSTWGERVEPLALDLWFNFRGAVEPPPDIAVVAMDESSYRVLEVPMDKAWPRSLHAELLKKLKDFGARRIAMDILFLGEGADAKADKELSEAFKLTPTVIAAESATREVATTAGSFTMEELLTPPDIFTKSADQIALARLPDDLGVVRRFVVPRTSSTRDVASLFEAAVGKDVITKNSEVPGERDFLWYYGPPGTISTYPVHQVLNISGALPQSTFKDKIVFVGLSLRTELGPAQKDAYRTPFYNRGSMFGVEIQATAAANLLTKHWIKRGSAWSEGLILFVTTLIVTFAIFYLRPHLAGLLALIFCLLWAVASYFLFLSGFFFPGVLLVCFVVPVSYLGSTLAYYFITQRSQQQVEKAFQMYLSPEMAKQMRSNPNVLSLGGESLYATALFTDIEGFTTITEKMTATEVSGMLNAYFTEVMNVVIDKKGTLIKFIGDAIFALWGAPIKHSDHAILACETALGLQRAVRKFNDANKFPVLNTRVGINTGTMVVGNLGSARRFDYTAIGDSVNLASRLEGLNRYFGTSILVSETVKKEAGSKIKMLSVGSIVVSGKTEAVSIYGLFDPEIDADIEALWSKALNKFRLRSWEESAAIFKQVLGLETRLKTASLLYLAEIEGYTAKPPDDEWSGQIVFDHK